MGQHLVIVFLSPERMCLIHSVPVGFIRFCTVSIGELAFLPPLDLFFYEWEHRTGTMCPFSSLHPLKKGKEV